MLAGNPKPKQYAVNIPRGVRSGDNFAVIVEGQQISVRCPEGKSENDRLIITVPELSQTQQFQVVVPTGVEPGHQFRVSVNTQEVMITCPPGVHPGQKVTFQLPKKVPTISNNPPAPTTSPTPAPPPAPTPFLPPILPEPPRPHSDRAVSHQMFEVTVPDGVVEGQSFALMAKGQRVMVTCPIGVHAGQKIRFQLPIPAGQTIDELKTFRVNYDKDGWMRSLGQDLKFHWVYNTVDGSSSINHDNNSFVRTLCRDERGLIISIGAVSSKDYSIDTHVAGTNIRYTDLTEAAQLPFSQKVDWLKSKFNSIRLKWEDGHKKVQIRRAQAMEDAVHIFSQFSAVDMKRVFRFEFTGEPALDAGGVAREFYSVVCGQIFNPDFGLFSYSAENQMCMTINPSSGLANGHHLRYFYTAGQILGKALMDAQIIPMHLVRPLYKHLLGWPITVRDVEHVDPAYFRSLMSLEEMEDVADLCLDFSITVESFGATETVDLIPGGRDISVTKENLSQYIESQTKHLLLTRVHEQLVQLLRGFYDVIPESLLTIFDFQELELVLHGLPTIDLSDWRQNTIYTGVFASRPDHEVVEWFWSVVGEFEQEMKAKLLQFVTGTAGVPALGFAYLQGNDGVIKKFCIFGDKDSKGCPRAHTCFNRIDLPVYANKMELKKYLTLALSMESIGFSIE